ncbi:SIMPL domain-containing protein [Desulfosporosinus sp. FKA]|uniref:SIMPL domain-containing protein n=1 Tax=Desulfosporosinus sp. FKA TaxID=1969834 RepID=UPI000B4A45D2|nr:SIMPL domain-containing protein [Desulfosporosinus sp. FKA]
MKKSLKLIFFALVLTLLFAQTASAAEIQQQAGTIETSATSSVDVDPDMVQLNLSVRTEASSAALAQENNSTAVNKAMDLLVSEGLSKDAITTTNYSTYSYTKTDDNTKNEVTVYSSNSGMTVTIKELDKVGEILDKLADISEVNVNSVNYSIQDPGKYKDQVIASAIAAAKQNILSSANALGVTIDKLDSLKIDFNSASNIQPYTRNSVSLSTSATPQPQSPEKITISATADLSYTVQQK